MASFCANIVGLVTSGVGYSVSPSHLAVAAFGSASYVTTSVDTGCCTPKSTTVTLPLFQWGTARPLFGFSAFTSAVAGCFNGVISHISCLHSKAAAGPPI